MQEETLLRGTKLYFPGWIDANITATSIKSPLNHYDCNPPLLSFSFSFFLNTHRRMKKSLLDFKKGMLSNKPLGFDGLKLNYYVLVVSWSYYKYLRGSIYHWDTVYLWRWISCARKGQWFRNINMWIGNPLCLDLKITAVNLNLLCCNTLKYISGWSRP